jgi:hypothetical protein
MKDSWKSIALGSVSCLTLMVGFWMVEAREYVTRVGVVEMIETRSPYVADRQLILVGIDNLNKTLEENNKTLRGRQRDTKTKKRLRAERDKRRNKHEGGKK